jgi:trimeric autotransporter adhesin
MKQRLETVNVFKITITLLTIFLIHLSDKGFSQISLTSSPYSQNFNGIGSGLPTGWTVRTGASATALGTAATLTTTATSWASTTGQFNNAASANAPATSGDIAATQAIQQGLQILHSALN